MQTEKEMMITVPFDVWMKFKRGVEQTLENVTEIHFNFKEMASRPNRIAFESDIEFTGSVYDLEEIDEFEAIENYRVKEVKEKIDDTLCKLKSNYEEYCNSKRRINEIPLPYINWLELEVQAYMEIIAEQQ